MASTSKAFRKSVDPCPRYLTPIDTHDCCVFCLGEEHARNVREGAVCVHCERFSMRKLRSRLSLFSRKEGQPSASRDSRPTIAEARRRMKSWGSQVDLADELERELSLSHESAKNEGEPLDYDDLISLKSSDPAASALLGYAQEEQEMSESEEVETELSQTSSPACKELLDVMEHATARLDLPWERTKMAAPRGRLDERYLSGHKTPAQVNLLFLPDLHTEVEKEWKKIRFPLAPTNSSKFRENGYERMPPVEENLASYLSMGETASLKVPSLPSKPLQVTSRLNGRAYTAAGQAVASLHTMAVLQAYQADLLKDLDNGQGLSPDEVAELRRTTDLALRATKQAATAMGRSMAAMVVTERHLWVNLADLEKKEKGFLLDAPISPPSFSVPQSRQWLRSLGRRERAQRPSKPSFQEGPGPSPNKAEVLARPGLRIGDGIEG